MGVNRVGDGNGIAYTGDSRIVDPLGELLATAAHTESILLADISAATVRSTATSEVRLSEALTA